MPVMMTPKGMPVTMRPKNTPIRDRITEEITMSDWARELNWVRRIMKMRNTATINALLRKADDWTCSS